MRVIFVLLIMAFALPCDANNSNGKENRNYTDTTVIPQILALPLQSYIGKPVDSLLRVLPSPYTDRGFHPIKLGWANGITQGYGTTAENNCTVYIYIDTFRFVPFPNYSKPVTWDLELAKKETISFIKVVKNDLYCLYGCDDPKYTY